MLKKSSFILIAALFVASSSAMAATGAVSSEKAPAVTKGGGFDVLNKTDKKITIVVNDHTLVKTFSNPGEYGFLPATWWMIKTLCWGKNPVCPAQITWNGKSIATTVNTETGAVDNDSAIDPDLPGLNTKLKPMGLKATLSNEKNGKSGRDGYALVTVSYLMSKDEKVTPAATEKPVAVADKKSEDASPKSSAEK